MASKRSANDYLTKEGGPGGRSGAEGLSRGFSEDIDPATRATAAQLAARKIKAAKPVRRGPGASRPQAVAQAPSNPFATLQAAPQTNPGSFSFNFGATPAPDAPAQTTPFTFGGFGTPAPSQAAQPTPAFTFGGFGSQAPPQAAQPTAPAPAQSPFSFGGSFGSQASQATQPVAPTQSPFSFGGTSGSQASQATQPTAPVQSSFGFGGTSGSQASQAPQPTATAPAQSPFSFGGTSGSQASQAPQSAASTPSLFTFGGSFGSQAPQPSPATTFGSFQAPTPDVTDASMMETVTPERVRASAGLNPLPAASSPFKFSMGSSTPFQAPQKQEETPAPVPALEGVGNLKQPDTTPAYSNPFNLSTTPAPPEQQALPAPEIPSTSKENVPAAQKDVPPVEKPATQQVNSAPLQSLFSTPRAVPQSTERVGGSTNIFANSVHQAPLQKSTNSATSSLFDKIAYPVLPESPPKTSVEISRPSQPQASVTINSKELSALIDSARTALFDDKAYQPPTAHAEVEEYYRRARMERLNKSLIDDVIGLKDKNLRLLDMVPIVATYIQLINEVRFPAESAQAPKPSPAPIAEVVPLDTPSNEDASGTAKKFQSFLSAKPAPSAFKVPNFGQAAPVNFLAQFGAKLAKQEKEKRKAEDFDSDEDNEDEWEKKDAEEQEAKRQKLMEVAKSVEVPKFALFGAPKVQASVSDTPKPASVATTNPFAQISGASIFDSPHAAGVAPVNPFAHLSGASDSGKGDADDEDSDTETEKPKGSSLFDRVTRDPTPPTPAATGTPEPSATPNFNPPNTAKSLFQFPGLAGSVSGSTTPAAAATAAPTFTFTPATTTSKPSLFSNLAGSGTSTPADSEGENAETKPKGTSLFARISRDVTPASTAAPGTPVFNFPSAVATPKPFLFPSLAGSISGTTTPALSEVGSGAESVGTGDTEEQTIDPQNDLVGMEKDKVGHDVLFESQIAAARKSTAGEDGKVAFALLGKGPIAVLRNQTTKVVSILMKKAPGGGVVINTRLVAKFNYTPVGKRAKFFTPIAGGGIDTWLVQFGSEEEAKEFCEACEGAKAD